MSTLNGKAPKEPIGYQGDEYAKQDCSSCKCQCPHHIDLFRPDPRDFVVAHHPYIFLLDYSGLHHLTTNLITIVNGIVDSRNILN